MDFIWGQLTKTPRYPKSSCAGQTVVITGSNTGLGKEAARHFARLGASRIILAVRGIEKGNAAKQDIEASTGCSKDIIQVWQVDMGSYASVQQFAAKISDLDRVDMFLANAGIASGEYSVLEDNEAMITVNVVSTLLLVALILPKMRADAQKFNIRPTISITSSDAHTMTTYEQKSAPEGQLFATLNDKATAEKYWGDQYHNSKLLQIFAVRSIGDITPDSSVTVNTFSPGLCWSELSREANSWVFYFMKLILARTTEVGSRTLVHAATSGPETHGKYLSHCEITAPSSLVLSAQGKEVQDRLWVELTKKLDAIKPGVTRNFRA